MENAWNKFELEQLEFKCICEVTDFINSLEIVGVTHNYEEQLLSLKGEFSLHPAPFQELYVEGETDNEDDNILIKFEDNTPILYLEDDNDNKYLARFNYNHPNKWIVFKIIGIKEGV